MLLVVCKSLAYGASLSAFRGGPTFPGMYIGTVGGIALSHLPGLPMIAGVAMGVGAMTVAMLGLPLRSVLIVVVFLQADAIALTPLVIVAVVVSYVTSARLGPSHSGEHSECRLPPVTRDVPGFNGDATNTSTDHALPLRGPGRSGPATSSIACSSTWRLARWVVDRGSSCGYRSAPWLPGHRLFPRRARASHRNRRSISWSRSSILPLARRGIVARTALVDRLVAASAPAVISVVAPAGYGKTTLLAQWAERKEPRVGWVSVDDRDNDPVVLLTYIAVALDRVEAIDPRVFRALASSGAGIEVPRRLVAAMARMRHPVALVIDNFEVVTNPESLDAIAALALGLPTGSQLAIGSRDVLPLPTARLRAQGGIVEVGIDDLAMDSHEAGPLLLEAGVELAGADLDELVRRTEGWPVGLYLAALAVNAGGSADGGRSGVDRR